MFNDKKARFAGFIFMTVAVILPMLGLLIMDDQLAKANDITGAATIEPASSGSQALAGVLLIALVVVGLIGLLYRFSKKAFSGDVDSKIENISEELKKL